MKDALKVFSGTSHPRLAADIAKHLGVEVGGVYFKRFANGNLKVRIEENVRESDVFVVQTSCCPVDEHLMETLILVDALRYASAARITAVLPYYPYVRSDKKDEPRISVTARLVADLLQTAGADRILTLNLHAMQIMAFSRIPVDQLDAIPIITNYLSGLDLRGFVAVAPDIGRAKVTEAYARRLGLPVAILNKERRGDSGEVEIRHVIGDVAGRSVVFFDDEILTGGSILAGVSALRERGAKRFIAACIHGILADPALDRIEASSLEKLVITDTIPLTRPSPKVEVCSVAALLAGAIRAIHDGTSVSQLFTEDSRRTA